MWVCVFSGWEDVHVHCAFVCELCAWATSAEFSCRDGLVGYDAALTQLRSRVRFSVFVTSRFWQRDLSVIYTGEGLGAEGIERHNARTPKWAWTGTEHAHTHNHELLDMRHTTPVWSPGSLLSPCAHRTKVLTVCHHQCKHGWQFASILMVLWLIGEHVITTWSHCRVYWYFSLVQGPWFYFAASSHCFFVTLSQSGSSWSLRQQQQ